MTQALRLASNGVTSFNNALIDNDVFALLSQYSPELLGGRQEFRPAEINVYSIMEGPEPFFGPRKYKGWTVPQLTKEYLGTLPLTDEPWAWPLISEIGPLAIRKDGKIISKAVCDRSSFELFGVRDSYELCARMGHMTASLPKNFMVMVRTVPRRDCLKILVRGSRYLFSSGQWVKQFCLWLSRFAKTVVLDLYDFMEVEEIQIISIQSLVVEVTRHKSGYYGSGEEYDVCIDDAWIDGGTVPWNLKSEFWSLKVHERKVDPYLHPTEGRLFSHPVIGVQTPCPCEECVRVSEVSHTTEDFFFLKALLIELGGRECPLPMDQDIINRKSVWEGLRTSYVEVNKRSAGQLKHFQHFHPLVSTNNAVSLAQTGGNKIKFSVGLGTVQTDQRDPLGWWSGKTVSFLGVPSSVLNGEFYVAAVGTSSFSSTANVLFLDGPLPFTTSAEIWSPQLIAGFTVTGRVYGRYVEQTRDTGLVEGQVAKLSLSVGLPLHGPIVPHLRREGVFRVTLDQLREVSAPVWVADAPIGIPNVFKSQDQIGYYGSHPVTLGSLDMPLITQQFSFFSDWHKISCSSCHYQSSSNQFHCCKGHHMARFVPIEFACPRRDAMTNAGYVYVRSPVRVRLKGGTQWWLLQSSDPTLFERAVLESWPLERGLTLPVKA